MSRIDEILNRANPSAEPSPSTGFFSYDRRPQMGFEIERETGSLDGFLYHNLDNLDIRIIRGYEHLVFTHRQKVVVIQGKNLKPILRKLLQHSIKNIRDFCADTPKDDEPHIDHIQIGNLENRDQMQAAV